MASLLVNHLRFGQLGDDYYDDDNDDFDDDSNSDDDDAYEEGVSPFHWSDRAVKQWTDWPIWVARPSSPMMNILNNHHNDNA